jgi:2-polyprenyl-3-methyl-5-hydroxy-6-metoxy-1,4-benzoquinol methylase
MTETEMMENQFSPHQIVWTYEKGARIWDYFAQSRAYEDNFFSKQVGDDIIDFVLAYDDLSGNILDYGCGHGFLIEKLLKRGISCQGLDFSEDSVRLVGEKFQNEPLFSGVTLAQSLPTPLEADKFDVVFFIETIEHVLKEDLNKTLREIYRLTKSGGYIFVTTPNEENLDAAKVI